MTSRGGLLPPDILIRVAETDAALGGLAPADYFLIEGERISEAVNRSWNRLRAAWHAFQKARETLGPNAPTTGMTRDRWLLPLFQELGYGRLQKAKAVEIGEKNYAISHFWNHAPVHLLGAVPLDRRSPGLEGATAASPHGLVQEFLNRSPDHLWGFVSNGLTLRILRDSVRLTRQSLVEFDLESMMEGELYADFRLMWLVCHASRVSGEAPEACRLERWRCAARDQGARILENLRVGVETAIVRLGGGFLCHPANEALRASLRDGSLETRDYFRQLLRLVYRLLFLFVSEDRDLLLKPEAPEGAAAGGFPESGGGGAGERVRIPAGTPPGAGRGRGNLRPGNGGRPRAQDHRQLLHAGRVDPVSAGFGVGAGVGRGGRPSPGACTAWT